MSNMCLHKLLKLLFRSKPIYQLSWYTQHKCIVQCCYCCWWCCCYFYFIVLLIKPCCHFVMLWTIVNWPKVAFNMYHTNKYQPYTYIQRSRSITGRLLHIIIYIQPSSHVTKISRVGLPRRTHATHRHHQSLANVYVSANSYFIETLFNIV